MARRKFVCGNWKMHRTAAEAVALVRSSPPASPRRPAAGRCRSPSRRPSPRSTRWPRRSRRRGIELAAQNVHWEAQGAFTGEVSAAMLAEAGCAHGIVGHSERRQLFGETDEAVRKKVRRAPRGEDPPIVCVGETLAEREAEPDPRGGRAAGPRRPRRASAPSSSARVTVAYEPVWAIGTGKTATPAQAQEVHAAIRKLLRELGGAAWRTRCASSTAAR